MKKIIRSLSKLKTEFFRSSDKPINKKPNIDFESDYQMVIGLLKEINQKDLKELEAAEWPSHKKMIKEAQEKIEEAIDLLELASKAPSNIVW